MFAHDASMMPQLDFIAGSSSSFWTFTFSRCKKSKVGSDTQAKLLTCLGSFCGVRPKGRDVSVILVKGLVLDME